MHEQDQSKENEKRTGTGSEFVGAIIKREEIAWTEMVTV